MASASERIGVAAASANVPEDAATSREIGERMANRHDASRRRERFNAVGWGLVFMLVGALALPSGELEYITVAGVGALMLGLNVALMVGGHRLDLFTLALGATALAAGLGAIGGLKIDLFALFFLVLGLVMVVVPLVRLAGRRRY
jgi:hypothetical protein